MYNDILKRLNAGESADAIAKELIDTLNKANAEYAKEQETKQKLVEKTDRLDAILKGLKTWIIDYYCENPEDVKVIEEAFADMSAADIIKTVDAYLALGTSLAKTLDSLYEAPVAEKVAAAPVKKTEAPAKKPVVQIKELSAEEADKVLKKFLNSVGW